MTSTLQKSDLDSICRRLKGEFNADAQGLPPRMEQLLRVLDETVVITAAAQRDQVSRPDKLSPTVNGAGIVSLKAAVKALWQMENELRNSNWSTQSLAKEKAQHHLGEARRRLSTLLDELNPIPQIVDQPPVLSED